VTTQPTQCTQCGALLPGDPRVCPACGALQPARDAFAPGITIDRGDSRIVLDARVGEGGMGVVWRAWVFRAPTAGGPSEPEPVGLKVLRPQAMARGGARELFLREADALQRLSHPNVVGFHSLFEHDGNLVLATEYVDGETLAPILARHVARAHLSGGHALPCMPLLRAWYYFQQLLGALAAIHALGIVHRDVKPSNVLVRRDGLVKLGDFGIARLAGAPPTALTQEVAPGTGAYMAPEQVLSRAVDARTDLYSAAIVLYEMLAGRTPFLGERGEFLVRKDQVDAEPPPLRTFMPQAPPVVDALFARALAKDPAARFDGAIEMGDAFRDALGLPDTPEWRAQADIAVAARKIAETRGPESDETQVKKLATLREFVVHGYKTMKLASM
jgi:serine/threonine protein kinase